MTLRSVFCLLAATALSGCALFGSINPLGEPREPTLASLGKQQVELEADQSIADGRQKAAATYREALAATANPRMEAEALRRLADLELEFAEEALIEREQLPAGNEFDDAIALYQSLLVRHPDDPGHDRVLYQLARAQENANRESEALATLDRLVAAFPESAYLSEAQFRRGEMLFRARRYGNAERAYEAVLALGEGNRYFAPALYKHGWALFKQSLHEESLASFFDLLDHQLIKDGALRDTKKLGKAQRELVEDSLRAVSISLSYFADSNSVDQWLAVRDPLYLPLVYTSLADLYVGQERYADAAETLRSFVQLRPLHAEAPAFGLRVIATWQLGSFPSRELEAREDFVSRYVPDASYWAENEPQPAVLKAVEQHLGELAQHYHALYQAMPDDEKNRSRRAVAATHAIGYYARSLKHFPQRESAGDNSFLMAELLFEVYRFDEAASAYERAAYDVPEFTQRAEAGYAALLAYNAHEKTLAEPELAPWRARAMTSALRFADSFPGHPEANAVLLRVAEDKFAQGEFKQALTLAGRVLQAEPAATDGLLTNAWLLSGHAEFERADFLAAEAAYAQVLVRLPEADPRRMPLLEKQAAAVYKQGELARESADFATAAEAFARAARVLPGSKLAAVASYDQADMLMQANDWAAAAASLATFIAKHPQHQLVGDARRRLVAAHEGGEDQESAAEALLAVADNSTDEDEREASLWQAAEKFEGAKAPNRALAVYERYVASFPARFDAAMEARNKLVELNRAAANDAAVVKWQRGIISAHQGAGAAATARSRTLAAHASMALALPLIEQYRAVSLKAPLKKALKQKKVRMEAALAALKEATGYQIVEINTHATYQIAALYGHMGQALLDSERPGKLSAEELEQYEMLLEEQAFPFEEKAIELHEANVARLGDGVFDEHIQASLDALAALLPARYAKRETSEDAVAQIH